MITISTLIPRALFVALCATVALVSAPSSARANPRPQGLEIPSALVIVKSSNKNQVHYAVQVDETCAPRGPSPVSPYWQMLERGLDVTEPLSTSEQRVLGLEQQEVTAEGIRIVVRGLRGRTFTIHTWGRSSGECASSVETTIGGVPARVAGVYVKQKLFGVSYVLLTGVVADGTVVQERFTP